MLPHTAILDTATLLGLDVLCDNRYAFINCTREVLLKDYVTVLPPQQVVVEVLDTVPPMSRSGLHAIA